MGGYCKFCDQRCFVHNPVGGRFILATCQRGKALDREKLGYNIDDVNELISEYVEQHGCDRETAIAKTGVEIINAESDV